MNGNLDKKTLIDIVIFLVKNALLTLETKAISSVLDKFLRKISEGRAVRAGKGFILFISNECIYEIVDSLEKSDLLIDGAIKTVKHEVKKQEGGILCAMMAPMAASLIAPKALLLIQNVALH